MTDDARRLTALDSSDIVHWIVPRAPNPLFTGRLNLLRELEAAVQAAVHASQDRELCRIVISGMGGQGKSELCLQLVRGLRSKSIFWAVLWIDISTTDIAQRAFLGASQKLSIPAQKWEDARDGIANLQNPWLLVLDNADDPEVDYQEYFPDGIYGVVIMTTRNEECLQYGTHKAIVLEGLALDEAQELLLKAAHIHTHQCQRHTEGAPEVARLLQFHPLALIQAGAYVSRSHCTLADYPRVYEEQRYEEQGHERRQQLLTYRPTQARSRYGDIYATFEVSARMLGAMKTQASIDALQLLSLLGVCGPSEFPLSLFQAGWHGASQVSPDLDESVEDEEVERLTPWHVAHLPLLCAVARKTWDPHRLAEAVACLKAFALVSTTLHEDGWSVSLHALVHVWARDRQDTKQQQQSWLQIGCLVALAVSPGEWIGENNRRLQPHIEALIDWPIRDMISTYPAPLVARILVNCGWFLSRQRADPKLRTFLHEVFTVLGLNRDEVERQWRGMYILAAENAMHLGQFKEAVLTLEKVFEIMKQTLPSTNLLRLSSQHELAVAYKAHGQVRRAVALLEEVVEIRGQILMKGHPAQLNSQHELASAYRADGQNRKAVKLLENIVRIRTQMQPQYQLARLQSQHELAVAYRANGQLREAVALLEEVVEMKRQIQREDHPSRLVSQHVLAACLWEIGKQNAGLSLMAQVVNVKKRVFDETHPDRLVSEKWLAIFKQETEEQT